MSERIAEDQGQPNHAAVANFFNQLLLDLKKQMLGSEHVPITMERLNEGTQHVLNLDGCRSPTKFWRAKP